MKGCRISTDWSFKGMKTLILENRYLCMVSLLDKGSDIIEILYKPLDVDVLWHAPGGYRNPLSFTPTSSSSRGAFLDMYGGGWQDILPTAGSPVKHRNAEMGVHGETALLPWSCRIEKEDGEEVEAYLRVDGIRYPYRVEKWIRMMDDFPGFEVRERLTNLSRQDLEFSWLQHPAFGEPLIAPGTRIDLPEESEVIIEEGKRRYEEGRYKWPEVKGRDGGTLDLSIIPERDVVYGGTAVITGFREGWYAVTNPEMKFGFALRWEGKVYPYLWFWQNYNVPDYPWYGMAWNMALEPCSSMPPKDTPAKIDNSAAILLKGGEPLDVKLTATLYTGLKKVYRVGGDGRVEG